MADSYNNVPMSERMAERVAKEDAFWTGPKLILLGFATLGFSFALLWSMSEGIIGPTQHEVDWGHEVHMLQSGGGPFD